MTFSPENLSLAPLNSNLGRLVSISQLNLGISHSEIDSDDIYRGRISFELQPNLSDSSYINQLKKIIKQIPRLSTADEISVTPYPFTDIRLAARFKTINYTQLVRQYVRVQSSLFDSNTAKVRLSADIRGQKIQKIVEIKLPFITTDEQPVIQNNFSLDIYNRLKIDLNEKNFMI